MTEKGIYKLRIDSEFKSLISPLTRKEFVQLENNILTDGCRDPIVTWEDIIIDGHNRYRICTKHNIPFHVVKKSFENRDDVLAWICANQLGRRNISEETRKFLIGVQYESEKRSNERKNTEGKNQHTAERSASTEQREIHSSSAVYPTGHMTAQKIGKENNVNWSTVYKYGRYANLIKRIGEKVPELPPLILSGKYRFSHRNLEELSELSEDQIRKIMKKLDDESTKSTPYKSSREAIRRSFLQKTDGETGSQVPSVKDMPEFDPDAELNSVALTIPSWISSIERAYKKSNFALVSGKTKHEVQKAALELQSTIKKLLTAIMEE